MPPESLSTSPEQTQQPILSPEQADFAIQSLRIPREKLDELTKNPEFQKDLKILQDNPWNTTEHGEFLKKYLSTIDKKDGWQILRKADGSIDFWGWLSGKTPEELKKMVKWLTRDEKESYGIYVENEWKKLDAKNEQKIATGQKLDATISDINQKKVEKIATGQKLDATISKQFEQCTEQQVQLEKSLSEEGKLALKWDVVSIKNNPSSLEYQELILKWVTEEQIKSGKADSMITALYTYNNQAKFLEKGWVEKWKEADFQKTVDNFSDILGKDRRNLWDIPKFVGNTLISWERKEMVLQWVDKLVNSGKYNLSQTTYNAESGYITFYGERKGESTRIDTSKNPPVLEYQKNGLSIGKIIEKQELSDEEKSREAGIEREHKNFSENKNTTRTALLQNWYQILIDPSEEGKKFIEKYQNFSFSDSLNPQKKAEMLTAINTEKIRVKWLPWDTSNTELDKKQKAAQSSIEKSLDSFKEAIDITVKNIDTLPKIPKDSNTTFERTAEYNLNFLTYIWYDTIGQENMEKVIRTLNSPENPKRSEIGEINLNEKLDTLKTQALTLAIANLVRAGRKENIQTVPTEKDMKNEATQKSWDDVDKKNHIIAARQTQSLWFREALMVVKRNMMNEWGSLKTEASIKSVLL